MGISGIYGIFNLVNGKVYIGSAINLKKRFSDHKGRLQKQKHRNGYLQNAWNKYRENEFKFCVLEHCPKERLIEREQFYLDSLIIDRDLNASLNIRQDGQSCQAPTSDMLELVA